VVGRAKTFLLIIVVTAICAASVQAQESKSDSSKPAEETPLQRVWKEFQTAAKESNGDPHKQIAILANYVQQHPTYITGRDVAANFGFAVADLLPKMKSDNTAMLVSLRTMDQAITAVAPYDRAEYDAVLASRGMLENKILIAYGAELARQSVALLNEDDYIANARLEHQQTEEYRRQQDKNSAPEPFNLSDTQAHFRGEKARRLATLGSLESLLCEPDQAEADFQQSLDLHPVASAYVGLARLEENKGEPSKALELLARGYLAGRMSAGDIDHLRALYGALYPKADDKQFQEYLGSLYSPSFRNPVSGQPYRASSDDPNHTVLAEFFTGAGCEPCMAPDLAFEAMLQRYNRNQVVLIEYHNNAPDMDPLTNFGSDERGIYYGTQLSTPHVFINGKKIDIEEGLPDHAQADYDKLTGLVDHALSQPGGGGLRVSARLAGQQVKLHVTGSVPNITGGAHLQIALLERHVEYSGANTLRHQPMVERALAGLEKKSSGFVIAPSGSIDLEYTFDLDQVAGENLRYYEYELAWLRSRYPLHVTYQEKRPAVDPDELAVAAFVQQDNDKRVIESSYAVVPQSTEPSATSTEKKGHE